MCQKKWLVSSDIFSIRIFDQPTNMITFWAAF